MEFPEKMNPSEWQILRKELKLAGMLSSQSNNMQTQMLTIRDSRGRGICAYKWAGDKWVRNDGLLLLR